MKNHIIMNLVKTLSISLFIFAALAVKASDSNVFNTTKADVNYTVFIIHSDVETKITEIRARIDSLKNILNTKKEEVAYADKQADIQKMLLQLQEFSDQIDLVEASQLSDGDKMMELVFVEYSLDGVDVDIAKLDKNEEVVVANTDEPDNTNTTTNNTNTTNNTTTTNNTIKEPVNNNNTTASSSKSHISRVNPANGELLQLSKGHYVVVMAFGVYKNATNFLNNVKSTNNQAGIIKNESRGLYYVYTNYSSDENQAIRDKNAQASKYKGAWVFSY
jgi:hypothetical protein